jgi:hypothetical protein
MAIMTASAGEQLERDLNKSCKALIYDSIALRAVVSYVEAEYEMSERHACRLLELARSTHRYRA